MAHKVNLDALIPREDLEVSDRNATLTQTSTLQITGLRPDEFFYNVLRKPDFQRETSDWPPDKIYEFVRSFLDGDLIPALILWQAGSQVFVIDGAHRLSALIAWVHDDYGDGIRSKNFFDSSIPREQSGAAEYTRRLIKRQIGSYSDHTFAIQNPGKSEAEVVERAKRMATLSVQLQWVKGDARTAEASFFRINQQASPIDKTELRLLQARKHANAVAARAIARAGTGHKYWSFFDETRRAEIEKEAKSINELLFSPTLSTPIKTLDLPVAGRGYSAQTLPLIFDFVNLSNDAKGEPKSKREVSDGDDPLIDKTGEETLLFLKRCHSIVNRISGTHPSSLGLHPAVYFYSSEGRYQPTAFMAVIELIKEYERKNFFVEFTDVRKSFEDFLLRHRIFVNQITVKYGSGFKGYARLRDFFSWVIEQFIAGSDEKKILLAMKTHSDFSFLQSQAQQTDDPEGAGARENFDTYAKSAVFLRDALQNPLRCAICGGLIHKNAITIDHIMRKSEGGVGQLNNGQLAHPFCNTTYKN